MRPRTLPYSPPSRSITNLLCALLVLASVSLGCMNKFPKFGGNNQNPGIVGSAEDVALTKKLDPFIQCMNRTDVPLRELYKSYLATDVPKLNGNSSFRMFNGFRLFPYEPENESVTKCRGQIESGLAASPQLEDIDGSGRKYLSAINELIPLLKEADAYYQQKNYKDDDFAKGKQMHPSIVLAFDQYIAAVDETRDVIDRHDEGLKARQLAQLEKDEGRKLNFLTNNLMQQARFLFRAGSAETPDPAQLRAALDQYMKAYEEAKQYAEAHPDETKPMTGTQRNVGGQLWTSMRSSAEMFLTGAKDLERSMREGANANMRDRQTAQQRFVRSYNYLIDSYNRSMPRVSTP